MKIALLLIALLLQTAEPYPGQSNHAEPPKDWYCANQNYELTVPPAHVCGCERMCDSETGEIREDRTCTVWCHADHCHCQVSNQQACR